MAIQRLLLLLLVASLLHLHAASSNPGNSTIDGKTVTAYDVLERYNLPRGLLPLGVKSYVLHEGAMEVTLSVPLVCDFNVTVAGRKYLIRYDRTDGGVIQPGLITQVYAVRFQGPYGLFLDFIQVSRAGDQIKLIFADSHETYMRSFPVSAFAHSPKCN